MEVSRGGSSKPISYRYLTAARMGYIFSVRANDVGLLVGKKLYEPDVFGNFTTLKADLG